MGTTMIRWGVAALLLAAPLVANAQEELELEYVDTELLPSSEEAEERIEGWDLALSLGASVAVGSNRSVVGQQDGTTFSFSLNLDTSARLIQGVHEWGSSLSISETVSKSPAIERFVKAADMAQLESTYYLSLIEDPQFGPFARATARAPLFRGDDVRADDQIYRIQEIDGLVRDVGGNSLRLTDPLRVMTLAQSLGLFTRPLREEYLEIDVRLGGGAREVLANDQLAVDDDEDTDVIEVVELQSFQQVGTEFALELAGSVEDAQVAYAASYEMMTPFYDSTMNDDRSAFELTNYEVVATLGFRLTDWASVDYEFAARRLPQLVEDWQIQNNLLLTFSYSVNNRE